MTTVACDGISLAVDSQWMGDGNVAIYGGTLKIHRNETSWFALSGDGILMHEIFNWIDRGMDHSRIWPLSHYGDKEFCSMIELDDSGKIYEWYRSGEKLVKLLAGFPSIQAFGSGGHVALGAMRAGVSAVRALQIASDVDVCTGGPIWVGIPGASNPCVWNAEPWVFEIWPEAQDAGVIKAL